MSNREIAESAARKCHSYFYEADGYMHADIKECHKCNEIAAIILRAIEESQEPEMVHDPKRGWLTKADHELLTCGADTREESQGQQEPSHPKCKSCKTILYRTLGEKGEYCDRCEPARRGWPAGGDDTRELREAGEQLMDSAARLVIGYESGKAHRPDTHGCDSCAENVSELKEDVGEFRRMLAQGEPR